MAEHQEFGVLGHLAPGQHRQAAQQTTDEQLDDRNDHSAMIPARQAAQAGSSNRAPQDRLQRPGRLGYAHERRNQKAAARRGEDPGDLLPAVHRISSLCKRWLLGTHQGSVDPPRLPASLNEFVFRFNRRHSQPGNGVLPRAGTRHRARAGRYHDILAARKPRKTPPQRRGTGHPPGLERPTAHRPWRTAEMQLQFPLRLTAYPDTGFTPLARAGARYAGNQDQI